MKNFKIKCTRSSNAETTTKQLILWIDGGIAKYCNSFRKQFSNMIHFEIIEKLKQENKITFQYY